MVQHRSGLENAAAAVLHPGTGQPIGPADLAPLFPMEVIKQEVATDQYIDIPDPVRDVYRLWRPTPLYRAHRLEYELELPENVRIFYKYEGTSPAGSHKPNTAVPQAYYNVQEGVTRIATETGAGQWGSRWRWRARSTGIELKVYMVKISYAAETLPAGVDGNLGRAVRAKSQPGHERRPRGCSPSIPTRPARSGSRFRKQSKTRPPATTPSTRSDRSSITCCCTKP